MSGSIQQSCASKKLAADMSRRQVEDVVSSRIADAQEPSSDVVRATGSQFEKEKVGNRNPSSVLDDIANATRSNQRISVDRKGPWSPFSLGKQVILSNEENPSAASSPKAPKAAPQADSKGK